ncbi:MAG: Fur family transcriptional regulator [Byssovorax sp.]
MRKTSPSRPGARAERAARAEGAAVSPALGASSLDALGAPDERAASMLACVRSSGLKLTPQRIAIVRELAADPAHPTAQELFERLRPALPTMSFATVYNTLDALASAGLCAALSLAPGASRFDPNMRPHDHAVCDRCGLLRDVPAQKDDGPPPRASFAAAPGFEVRAVERIYRGLCADCARAEGPARAARS